MPEATGGHNRVVSKNGAHKYQIGDRATGGSVAVPGRGASGAVSQAVTCETGRLAGWQQGIRVSWVEVPQTFRTGIQ